MQFNCNKPLGRAPSMAVTNSKVSEIQQQSTHEPLDPCATRDKCRADHPCPRNQGIGHLTTLLKILILPSTDKPLLQIVHRLSLSSKRLALRRIVKKVIQNSRSTKTPPVAVLTVDMRAAINLPMGVRKRCDSYCVVSARVGHPQLNTCSVLESCSPCSVVACALIAWHPPLTHLP